MATEGQAGGGSEVNIVVSSTGATVRPVTVFLVTSDLTATGKLYFLYEVLISNIQFS